MLIKKKKTKCIYDNSILFYCSSILLFHNKTLPTCPSCVIHFTFVKASKNIKFPLTTDILPSCLPVNGLFMVPTCYGRKLFSEVYIYLIIIFVLNG